MVFSFLFGGELYHRKADGKAEPCRISGGVAEARSAVVS
jgi:hypothetical protein